MPLHDEARLQALLERYEGRVGNLLRQRREQAAAGRAFLERFRRVHREVLQPCLKEIAERLRARGLAARISDITSYDEDLGLVAHRFLLALPSPGAPDPVESDRAVPGVAVIADARSRQLSLEVRSIVNPGQAHVSELPLVEQLTAEVVEEEILQALEHVLFA